DGEESNFSWSCIIWPSSHNGGLARQAGHPGKQPAGRGVQEDRGQKWATRENNCRAREGEMADKSTQMLLDALGRAVTAPAGVPLVGTRTAAGLFSATPAGKQAAQRCLDLGYLRVVGTETKGKAPAEVCAITEKGLAFLLSQVSPRQVLEDFVRTLEARQTQMGDLVAAARQTQATLEALKATVEKVLQRLSKPSSGPPVGGPGTNGSETWKGTLLSYLAQC